MRCMQALCRITVGNAALGTNACTTSLCCACRDAGRIAPAARLRLWAREPSGRACVAPTVRPPAPQVTLCIEAADAIHWFNAQGSRSRRGTSHSWCGPARRPSAAAPRSVTSAPCSPCSSSATTAPRATCPASIRQTCCQRPIRLRRAAAVIKTSQPITRSASPRPGSAGRRQPAASFPAATSCCSVQSLAWRADPPSASA